MQMSKFRWINTSSEFSAGVLERKVRKQVMKLEESFQASFGHVVRSAAQLSWKRYSNSLDFFLSATFLIRNALLIKGN